jgi:hypothetical protein
MDIYTKYILSKGEEIRRFICEFIDDTDVDEINGISEGFLIKYIDNISQKYKIFHDIILVPLIFNSLDF